MTPRAQLASLVAVWVAVVAGPAVAQSDVAREWLIREWALARVSGEPNPEIANALSSPDWTQRHAGFDGLTRAVSAGGQLTGFERGLARARTRDPHPNVRAAALRLLAADGNELEDWPDANRLVALAGDALPEVRVALAQLCQRLTWDRCGAALWGLASDSDVEVVAAARAALFGVAAVSEALPPADADATSRWAELMLVESGALHELLAERPVTDAFLETLGEVAQRADRFDPRERRAWRADVEAARLLHGRAFDQETLIAGWLAGRSADARRRALLLGASALGGDALADALLDAAEQAANEESPWADDARAEGFADGFIGAPFLEAAGAAVGAMGVLRRGHERSWEWGSAPMLATLEMACAAEGGWDGELGRAAWLGSARAEREGLEEAWGAAARAGDRASAELLAFALERATEDRKRHPWRLLMGADNAQDFADRLIAAWKSRSEEQRTVWLNRVKRRAGVSFLGAELLRFGDSSRAGRATCAELIAEFGATAVASDTLARWLKEELEHWEDVARIGALVRSLAAVSAVEPVDELQGALEASARRAESRDWGIGDVSAELLARTPGGRVRLRSYLGEDIPQRIRLRAALGLVEGGSAVAVRRLIADFDTTRRDLRAKVLSALANSDDALGVEFVHRVLKSNPGQPFATELVLAAVNAVAEGALAREARIAALGERVRNAPSYEVQTAAARALARLEGADAAAELTAARLELAREDVDDELGSELARHLEGVLLECVANTGAAPEGMGVEVWRNPSKEAAEILGHRFAGLEQSEIGFRRRAELTLADALLRLGRETELLQAAGGLERYDARFLLELAVIALRTGAADAAREFARAGHIGLAGEAPPSASEAARALRILKASSR